MVASNINLYPSCYSIMFLHDIDPKITVPQEVGVISEFGPHRLFYKPTSKTGQTLEKQIFEIDGNPVPFRFHPLTLGSSPTKKARRRAQLTGRHASQLCLAAVDEHSREVTKIIFPNGTVNYVFQARKNSTCQRLRNLHHYLTQEGKAAELESFIGSLTKSRFLTDDLGGGRYIVSGYGNLGRNTKRHLPGIPSMRQSLQLSEHLELGSIVGGALSHVSCCIEKHCKHAHRKNEALMQINPKLQWPSRSQQPGRHKWMCTQFIVRHWGGTGLSRSVSPFPLEEMTVSAHVDRGDLDALMPSIYFVKGGSDDEGGYVLGTDLVLFEDESGGAGVQVRTCIRDTVVVVLSNSRRQLHGCILDDCHLDEDTSPHRTTRIIPFTPKGVHDWMIKNPTGVPVFDQYSTLSK